MSDQGATTAFLFDWDGTVVDSSPLHQRSWVEAIMAAGHPDPQQPGIGHCGLKTRAVMTDLLGWKHLPDEELDRIGAHKEELYRAWVRRDGLPAIPGVLDFLRHARTAGIALGVGTSAPRANFDACLDALRLRGWFDTVVTGEDVQRGKPEPDVFLRVAAGLRVPPTRCVVFEDAPAGIRAGKAAGMRVVGVLTSHPAAALAGADLLIKDFDGLTPESILHAVFSAGAESGAVFLQSRDEQP
jgi:HAD superfamily hydrolase (TIGR01509 family)